MHFESTKEQRAFAVLQVSCYHVIARHNRRSEGAVFEYLAEHWKTRRIDLTREGVSAAIQQLIKDGRVTAAEQGLTALRGRTLAVDYRRGLAVMPHEVAA